MTNVSRTLTIGEFHVCQGVFGGAINYNLVRIHNYAAYPFQDKKTAVTPNGELYFPAGVYKPDFSVSLADAAWLVHEMTHVWQHQQGMWLRVRAVFNHKYPYGNLSDRSPTLTGWGVEQQASIVADYYLIRHGAKPEEGSGAVSDYERIIPFLPGRSK